MELNRQADEFVLWWATRHRLPDPEKVVQWWRLVEEPQRNLYNSDMVGPYLRVGLTCTISW